MSTLKPVNRYTASPEPVQVLPRVARLSRACNVAGSTPPATLFSFLAAARFAAAAAAGLSTRWTYKFLGLVF